MENLFSKNSFKENLKFFLKENLMLKSLWTVKKYSPASWLGLLTKRKMTAKIEIANYIVSKD